MSELGTTIPQLDTATDARGCMLYAVEGATNKKVIGGEPKGLATLNELGHLDQTQRPPFTPLGRVLVSGTSYTPVKADAGKWIETTHNGGLVAITIRGEEFDDGDELHFCQMGDSQLGISGGTGDDYFDIRKPSHYAEFARGQYSVIHLHVRSTSLGVLYGDLEE